jgi:hypothetical protein
MKGGAACAAPAQVRTRVTTDMNIPKPPLTHETLDGLGSWSDAKEALTEEKIAAWAGEESPTMLYERIKLCLHRRGC